MVGINEGMCVVYYKWCVMFDYVVKWNTCMSHNSNNITWCYKLSIIFIIFITKLYNIIIQNIIIISSYIFTLPKIYNSYISHILNLINFKSSCMDMSYMTYR